MDDFDGIPSSYLSDCVRFKWGLLHAIMQCSSPRFGYSPTLAATARDALYGSASTEASPTRALLASRRIRHLCSSVFGVIGVDAQEG